MAKGKYLYWISKEGLLKIGQWARDGLTEEQIAKNIGISRSTLNEWKKIYPDISDTIKKGKEIVDTEVENALLKRALGYRYTETTREPVMDLKTGKAELQVTKVVEKEVIPDVGAAAFWLKNRMPDKWKDKRNVEVNGKLEEEKGKLDDILKQMRGRPEVSEKR